MWAIRQIYDLQLLDWDIQKREEDLAGILETLADDSERVSAGRRLDALQQKLDDLVEPRSRSESAIQQAEQRLSEIERRMYSGFVTNPRELEAFQEEQATLNRNRSAEEDSLLDYMVEMEETQSLRDEARVAFEQIDGERNRLVAELGALRKELESELPELHRERQAVSSEQPQSILAIYETVRRSRGGQGVALMDNRGLCGGCRLTVTSAEMQRVRASREIVQCGSCSRILVFG
jgi:predicted  nucleic acid-binding Zn-ribbon protein